MMKRLSFLALLSVCFLLSSCFKDEPLNAEADIERVSVAIDHPLDVFFNLSDTAQQVLSTDNNIRFNVRSKANLTALAPRMQLTPGATMEPASGTVRDFSKGPLTYVVTSEDGQWHRTYNVSFVPTMVTVPDTVHFSFEHSELEEKLKKYYVWYESAEDGGKEYPWASGNAGFNLSMSSAAALNYPTYPQEQGYKGACAALTTRSTGLFGVLANKRLAAGSLFLGTFDVTQALKNTLHATRFGVPFARTPLVLKGYYNYQPGEKYQDVNGNIVSTMEDKGAIYAVLYRNHDDAGNAVVLYGDDVKTSQQIVAIADMGDISRTNGWQPFRAEFLYRSEINPELLANQGYSLALVFSSSKEGDHYEGAIGSTLLVDEVEIICQIQE